MKRAILALFLIASCLPVIAAGKVTTDPNTSGAVSAPKAEEIDGTDTRLSQRITLSESRKMVSEILDDLTKAAGVTFRAGYNSNDWQVRDRRMSVFVKDVPLVQVMNSISHVMKFKWDRKGEEGKWTYRLYMDRRSLLDAETQRLREEDRQRGKAIAERKKALDQYMNSGNLSKADLAKMRETDPLNYLYTSSGLAPAMGQMFREVPTLSDAMAAGQEITVAGSDMSPQGRDAITGMVKGLIGMFARMQPDKAGMIDKLKIDPVTASIQLNSMLAREDGSSLQHLLLADVQIRAGKEVNIDLPLMDPDSEIGHAIGRVLLKLAEGQIKPEDIGKEMESEMKSAVVQDVASITKELGEPLIQHPDDPAVKAKVKLNPDSMKLADVQKALADAASYAVISDSFGKNSGSFGFVKSENELGTLLDKLTKEAFYNWDKKASVIEFRDREWFRKRAMQIPEADIERWRQDLRTTGTLDLPDLADMARLDGEQFNLNVQEDDFLGGQNLGQVIMLYRDVLRLYGSLMSNQRSAILSDSGLDLRDLNPEQYEEARKLIYARRPKLLEKKDAQIILKIAGKPEGKQIKYTFTVTAPGEKDPLKIEFTTPKYQEPKKQDKPADKPKTPEQPQPAQPGK